MRTFNQENLKTFYSDVAKRKVRQSLSLYPVVTEIIEKVVNEGDEAIRIFSQKFDGCAPAELRVTKEALKTAYDASEPLYIEALRLAIENITAFHTPQKLEGYEIKAPDKYMGQRVLPLARVGIYVPGGEAAYPSTLLMNAVPAQIAGVKEIVIVTPPQLDYGKLEPLFAAAYLLNLDEVYLVGGVQAIAALSYGTESIAPVDKITGPGNQYVAAAKKLVFGDVAIDMIAGPSEVLIISDGTMPISYIAADLLAQLEHDAEAMAILLTTSKEEAKEIEGELLRQTDLLKRQDLVRKALDQNTYVVICEAMDDMVEISNKIAPEHLELMVKKPEALLTNIKNAGSVFLGAYTPEALGDYTAGPNHTLPTTGTARFASPLGTYDFQKRMNVLYYSKDALMKSRDAIVKFTEKERLEAHGKAVTIRI